MLGCEGGIKFHYSEKSCTYKGLTLTPSSSYSKKDIYGNKMQCNSSQVPISVLSEFYVLHTNLKSHFFKF